MPTSTLAQGESVADELLLSACSETLRLLGARVQIRLSNDNLVRALSPAETFAPRGPAPWVDVPTAAATPPIVAEVEACGLPNLLHEFVHIALAGRLADDHGIDYQAIPYDLTTVVGRAVLWDEVAACVVSCAYLLPPKPGADAWARVDEWFDEQLGIQPVFYGMDHDPERFWATLPLIAQTYADECAAMTGCAYARVAKLLAWGAGFRRPVRTLSFDALWRRRCLPR